MNIMLMICAVCVVISGFHITGGNWNLEVGRQYALTVQVYDIKNHALFMSEVSLLVCVQ